LRAFDSTFVYYSQTQGAALRSPEETLQQTGEQSHRSVEPVWG